MSFAKGQELYCRLSVIRCSCKMFVRETIKMPTIDFGNLQVYQPAENVPDDEGQPRMVALTSRFLASFLKVSSSRAMARLGLPLSLL